MTSDTTKKKENMERSSFKEEIEEFYFIHVQSEASVSGEQSEVG